MQARHERHILVVAEIDHQVLKASSVLAERSTGDLLKRKNIRAVFGVGGSGRGSHTRAARPMIRASGWRSAVLRPPRASVSPGRLAGVQLPTHPLSL